MRSITKQLNFIFLSLSVIGIVSSILLFYTSTLSLFTAQLFSGSIASLCIFFSLSILNKPILKHQIFHAIGYLIVIFFLICIFWKTEWLSSIWNILLATILLLLFSALDEKLQLTSLNNYKTLMLISRFIGGAIVLGTLFKVSSPVLLSTGLFLLMLLSISSIIALFFQKKKEE